MVFRLSFLAAILIHMTAAHADAPEPIVRVLCAPELNLFEVDTFISYDITTQQLPADGFFTLAQFVASGGEKCRLDVGPIEVRAENYHPPFPTGQCGGVEDAVFTVWFKDTEIDRLEHSHDECSISYEHHLRADHWSYTRCQFELTAADQALIEKTITVPAKCKSVPLIKPR